MKGYFTVVAWLLLLGFFMTPAQAKRVALVIGNSEYAQLKDLKNPEHDAEAVAEKLKGLGFELVGGKAFYNLGAERLLDKLYDLQQSAKGVDMALLYYAGHGVQVKGKGAYLLPVDAPKRTDMLAEGYRLDRVLKGLTGKAELTIAVFDACREVPEMAEAVRAGGGELRSMAQKNIDAGRGEKIIAFSAASGEYSQDGSGKHSPYTKALLNRIDESGWEIGDLFRQVASEVAQQNDRQRPEVLTDAKPRTYYFQQFMKQYESTKKVQTNGDRGSSLLKKLDALHLLQEKQKRQLESVTPNTGTTSKELLQGSEFVYIAPDCFDMGPHPDNTDEREHYVCIKKGYWLAKTEVTVGQFKRFVTDTGYQTIAESHNLGCLTYNNKNEWGTHVGYSWRNPGFQQTDAHPVVCVSWFDVQAYIKWLNEQTKKNYRLPTEAEWEYAARGGTQSSFFWGVGVNKNACTYANILDKAWSFRAHFPCYDNYKYTMPVGQKLGNKWGLKDMIGNVWEWTCSRKNESYGKYDGSELVCIDDEEEVINNRISFVWKGGSWFTLAESLISQGVRYALWLPHERTATTGFRLALD